MKEIKLTQGRVAQVDDEDFEELSKYKWFAHQRKGYSFYAIRHQYNGYRQYRDVKMHQQIMGIKGGDHKDGNGMNNQRHNLRRCTHQQNCMNVRPRAGCSSKFKGVSYHQQNERWRATIVLNGKQISLGCYATEEEAAVIYNRKAAEVFGEFARLNVV